MQVLLQFPDSLTAVRAIEQCEIDRIIEREGRYCYQDGDVILVEKNADYIEGDHCWEGAFFCSKKAFLTA